MHEFIFATEHIQTTQGWFLPGHLLPKMDLPEEEGLALVEAKKAAICAYDSPLAKAVHESRAMDPHAASVYLKGVMETLSPFSPGDEPVELTGPDTEVPPADDWTDPTPEGEFPSLETFEKVGYHAEDYEPRKQKFYEAKAAAETLPVDAVKPTFEWEAMSDAPPATTESSSTEPTG